MLIRIESPDNGRLKLVRRLKTRRGRIAEGRFVAEGINLVREVIERGLAADFIIVSDDFEDREFIERCSSEGRIPVCTVPPVIFNRLTDADHGVGILAVVKMAEHSPSLIDKIPAEVNILVLDRIQDPGNMGTIIRTAVASGYGMILATKGTADIYSPKVLRSTAGMIFDMPVVYADNPIEAIRLVFESGRRLVVTVPEGGRPYYEEDLKSGIALAVGNEGNGVSAEMLSSADLKVTLPMKGKTESLNAAVSASILMYEAVRE